MIDRLPPTERFDSLRGWFFYDLYNQMIRDERIYAITADLGWGGFDKIKRDMPDRFINVGAAEITGLGVSVGLAESGKIPVFYSITTFGLYRGFEVIRNYINHEQIPVKLALSGRDKDYVHDGFSHWSEDAKSILTVAFPNIVQYWPDAKEEIPDQLNEMLNNGKPSFMSLKR